MQLTGQTLMQLASLQHGCVITWGMDGTSANSGGRKCRLVRVDDVAMGVGEYLDLDMASLR
jgi:hypothetical protein